MNLPEAIVDLRGRLNRLEALSAERGEPPVPVEDSDEEFPAADSAAIVNLQRRVIRLEALEVAHNEGAPLPSLDQFPDIDADAGAAAETGGDSA